MHFHSHIHTHTLVLVHSSNLLKQASLNSILLHPVPRREHGDPNVTWAQAQLRAISWSPDK